jgi:pimeloyl-ACP methyl ester carboxylesterase
LIETGGGTPSYLWFPVQDGVAEFTRVCTYDRAGFGWSEPARLPLSMSQRVKELHTLLSRAGVPGPFVMVGHSYGGALVRLFAHDYSDQVVGLVRVDSTEEILASNTHPQDAIKTQLASLKPKKSESQFSITRVRLRNDPVLAAACSPPAYVAETSDESLSMLGIRAEMRELGGPGALGDLPLAVISHGEPIDETPAGMLPGQFEQQWQRAQERLAKLSSNSELVIAKHSSHNVQLSQPGLIVDEINLLVAAVRKHVPLSHSHGTPE